MPPPPPPRPAGQTPSSPQLPTPALWSSAVLSPPRVWVVPTCSSTIDSVGLRCLVGGKVRNVHTSRHHPFACKKGRPTKLSSWSVNLDVLMTFFFFSFYCWLIVRMILTGMRTRIMMIGFFGLPFFVLLLLGVGGGGLGAVPNLVCRQENVNPGNNEIHSFDWFIAAVKDSLRTEGRT